MSSNTTASPATQIKRGSASLSSCYLMSLALAACLGSTQTLTPRLWVPLYGLCESREPTVPVLAMKKGQQTWKAKDLLAGKRVIYSWPLDSPFQMLDHVKQSINITCAGAFMGPHPLLLIYIPRLTQRCNQSCADASSQAANNMWVGVNQHTADKKTFVFVLWSFTAGVKLLYTLVLNVRKSFYNTT